jgi:hypothetical protein
MIDFVFEGLEARKCHGYAFHGLLDPAGGKKAPPGPPGAEPIGSFPTSALDASHGAAIHFGPAARGGS